MFDTEKILLGITESLYGANDKKVLFDPSLLSISKLNEIYRSIVSLSSEGIVIIQLVQLKDSLEERSFSGQELVILLHAICYILIYSITTTQ